MPDPDQLEDSVPINTITTMQNMEAYLLPTPRVIPLWGYVGDVTTFVDGEEPDPREAYRLYLSVQFTDYVEFRHEDVVGYRDLASPLNPIGGMLVWLRAGAQISRVHVDTLEQQAGFLQGGIAGSSGTNFAGLQRGAGLGMANTFGGCGSFAVCGGGSFAGCGSFAVCGGGSFGGCGSFAVCGGGSFGGCR